MSGEAPDAAADIEKIAVNLLRQSRAWGVLPTPIDRIIQEAELSVAEGVDLSRIEPSFLARFEGAARALKKVLGILDYRQKVIYLDHSQKESRNNFIKLHETTHSILPWQRQMLAFLDDEDSIDPDVKATFEREANYGASSLLFQLERFDDEAQKLPLSIKSPQVLARMFGGSAHAAIRRYVQRSPKRCAVLVLHQPEQQGNFRARVRDYFQSASFTAEFGWLNWPEFCGWDYPFIQEIKFKRRLHEDGKVELQAADGSPLKLTYHFFNNSFNAFILILPKGERVRSRVQIIER